MATHDPFNCRIREGRGTLGEDGPRWPRGSSGAQGLVTAQLMSI